MTVAGYRYRVSPLLWRLGCFSSSYGFRVFGQVYLNPLQALNDQTWHPKKNFPSLVARHTFILPFIWITLQFMTFLSCVNSNSMMHSQCYLSQDYINFLLLCTFFVTLNFFIFILVLFSYELTSHIFTSVIHFVIWQVWSITRGTH